MGAVFLFGTFGGCEGRTIFHHLSGGVTARCVSWYPLLFGGLGNALSILGCAFWPCTVHWPCICFRDFADLIFYRQDESNGFGVDRIRSTKLRDGHGLQTTACDERASSGFGNVDDDGKIEEESACVVYVATRQITCPADLAR